MVFFLNLIISVIYCEWVSRDSYILKRYIPFAIFFPILILWTLICGSQYYVGSDYPAYISLFLGNGLDYYSVGGEIGFVYFIKFFNWIGLKGQDLYYIIYFLSFFCFYKIIENINIKYWGAFILIYIVASSLFNNQLNIVRQSFSIYIGTLAVIQIYKKKNLLALLLIICATTFHISSILFLCYFLFRKKISEEINNRKLYIFLIFGFLGGLLISVAFFDVLIPYLPPAYAWHLQGGGIDEISFINKITKYIYIPLYILSIYNYQKYNLNGLNRWLYNWGIVGFSIRLLFMNMQIINRLSFIFLIVALFPILFYLRYLVETKKQKTVFFIYFGLVLFYGFKVLIAPSKEYAYDSVFFHLM